MILRDLIRDVLYEHTYGLYRADGYQYGMGLHPQPDDATWRCECGWTTLDHHNGTSEFIDHSEHVADKVAQALRGRRMIDRTIEAVTGYARNGVHS